MNPLLGAPSGRSWVTGPGPQSLLASQFPTCLEVSSSPYHISPSWPQSVVLPAIDWKKSQTTSQSKPFFFINWLLEALCYRNGYLCRALSGLSTVSNDLFFTNISNIKKEDTKERLALQKLTSIQEGTFISNEAEPLSKLRQQKYLVAYWHDNFRFPPLYFLWNNIQSNLIGKQDV